MRVIRLAVCSPVEAEVAAIVDRLRGAVIDPSPADFTDFLAQPDRWDALMVTRLELQWLRDIEHALSGGLHVLLVANPHTPKDAIEGLAELARKRGLQLSVVNPDRYLPSRQLIRKQLGGPLGAAGLIRVHRWESSTSPQARGLPDPLVRDLDMALWLAGRRPERVSALQQKSDAFGRYLQVHLGFSTGGMALLDYTNRLPAGDGYSSLSVIAATGAAYADDHQNVQLVYRGGFPQAVRTEERAGQLAAVAQDFVDALREARDISNIAGWKDVFKVVTAVEHSLESGKAIVLEDR
jgi:predicted dehydrogenase